MINCSKQRGLKKFNLSWEHKMFTRRGHQSVDRIEPGIRRWTYHDDGGPFHGHHLLLSEMGSSSLRTISYASRLEIIVRCNETEFSFENIFLHQHTSSAPNHQATRHMLHVSCTFSLDLKTPYEPVWGIWGEYDSDLEWAGAALFMCAQNRVGIVSGDSGPNPGIWGTHVHTRAPKYIHPGPLLVRRNWYHIYIHGFIHEDIKRGREGFISFGTLSQPESKSYFL